MAGTRRRYGIPMVLFGLVALGSTGGAARQTHALQGIVGNAATGAPIPHASVSLADRAPVFAGADGVFRLDSVPPGTHRLALSAPGFAGAAFDFTISQSMPAVIEVGLVPLSPLAPIAVRVTGTVIDSTSREPLTNAEIFIAGEAAAVTNPVGEFTAEVSLAPGPHLVLVRAVGYRLVGYEMSVATPGTVILTAALPSAPFTLAGIEVVERDGVRGLRGFMQRMESEIGQFLTPADIEELRKRSLTTSELLARVPGVMVRPTRFGRVVSLARCGRPELFLDGQPLEAAELDDVIPVEHIAAVEVYSDPGRIPPQFNRLQPRRGRNNYGACGAILFWTIIGHRNDG